MPDAAPEIVFTGADTPLSWADRAGHFVREKVIVPHTPEAHYQDIMRKYFWVTDRLEGKSLELARKARPAVELYAKAAGWSQTIMELYLAGSAVAITAILAGKGLKSAAGVFGEMARRHGSKGAEGAVALLTAGAGSAVASHQEALSPAVPSSSALDAGSGGAGRDGREDRAHVLETIHEEVEPADDDGRLDGKPRKKKRMSAKARRNENRRRRGIPVTDEDDMPDKSPPVLQLGENGREPKGADSHPPSHNEVSMDSWEKSYDDMIGTDPDDAAAKPAVVGLLRQMMLDTEVGGFRDGLAQALAEPNVAIRGKKLNALIVEAGEAFGADVDVLARAQLLVEAATKQNGSSY